MTILEPSYIPVALIQNQPRVYQWNDWDPYETLGEPDNELVYQLSKLTNRAIFSFAIGCVEWVVYRFPELQNNLIPFEYIEALWVAQMVNDIDPPPETNEDEWEGAVLAPVDLAIVTALNCMNIADEEVPDADAAFSDRIVRFILTDDTAYIKWRNEVLVRLISLYPRSEENEWGVPVPREALNIDKLITHEIAAKFVTNFLSKDFTKNRFIKQ